MEQGRVEQLLSEMCVLMHQSASNSKDLWDIDDVAFQLGYATKYVQRSVVTLDSFPRPSILPTGGKRWVAAEVRAWAKRFR